MELIYFRETLDLINMYVTAQKEVNNDIYYWKNNAFKLYN
jgi:hypothetical protein